MASSIPAIWADSGNRRGPGGRSGRLAFASRIGLCAAVDEVHLLRGANLRGIDKRTGSGVHPLDAFDGALNDTNQFGSIVCGAVVPHPTHRLLGGKPGGTPIQFLRWVEPEHLTQIGFDREFDLTPFGPVCVPASNVARKRSFFDAAMNSSFLEGFECRRLSVS